jgi:predicted nuclease of predicted toxin-antitoxin system
MSLQGSCAILGVTAPIRDVNDIIVMQTAIIGEADILGTKDDDFFEKPASEYLSKMGISVLDDISLMRRLRS